MEGYIMNLATWQPKEALDNLFDTDRFFNAKPDRLWAELEAITPKVNVTENENFFHLEAATPGMQDKDINIEVHNDVLTIKGHKKDESDTKKENYHIREFSSQNFERSFKLSDRIDTDKVTAKIDNGVLRVDLPKHEQTKPQKIEVQSNS
tara:strand:+ start:147 stop:596 length:450 start_codon:yes stop_codon:yes gene_type:complete